MIEERIAHYRIINKLGAGGMGEVFLAEDTRLGRKVAIKILSQNFINDEKLILRFKQEARAVSALNHPNILTLFDIGEDNSTLFIATEFVKGETLRQRLAGGKLDLQTAIDITVQIANALVAAHQAGIIHRDIKPENIMVRDDGYVKVLDFGLAKLSEPKVVAQDSSLPTSPMFSTEPGLVMGTTQYMSPEQMRGLNIDERTDIFSLGVVLYEMLSGTNPFAGATVSDVIAAILEREPKPLVNVSPEIQNLVSKALNKAVTKRYQNVQAFLDDLKEIIKPQTVAHLKPVESPILDYAPPRVQATQESFVLETQKALAVNSAASPEQKTVLHTRLINLLKKPQVLLSAVVFLLLFLLALVALFSPFKINRPDEGSKPIVSIKTAPDSVPQKLYLQMSEEEKIEFIRQQAKRISGMLGEGGSSKQFHDEAIQAIKQRVDNYAARSGNLSQKLWAEDSRIVFGRANAYARVITKACKENGVPPLLGIYIPFLETEYRNTLTSPAGSKGLFQFLPGTAQEYGLAPEDVWDVEKTAPLAARFLADRITEFGSDASSMELVILSFNRSPDKIRKDLRELRTQNPNLERSFWTLFDNADRLDIVFRGEGMKYVPKFIAAAIVGENPQNFDLGIKPLSEQE
jgi:serine/threonine protein kinase